LPTSFEWRRREFLKSALSLGASAGFPSLLHSRLLALEKPATDEIPYGVGNWSTDAFDPRGNHRIALRVKSASDAVGVRLPWRRHDANPEKKNILLLDAATGTVVKNLVCLGINREFGELVFQPQQGPGDYFLYYLPTDGPGRSKNYPVITYPPLVSTADPAWMERNQLAQAGLSKRNSRVFPQAEVVQLQSVDAFNAVFPMGVIATAAETQEVLRRYPGAMLLFPEDRSRSIRMAADLPRRWVAPGAQKPFEGNAESNEYYAMQIGAYAAQEALADIQVIYGEFRTRSGASLPSSAWTCFNTGGVDWSGHAFAHELSVEQGRIQPLWLGVQIPEDAHAGEYRGTITVWARNAPPVPVEVNLTVGSQSIADHGDSDPSRLSRLRWLNSRLAEDDSIVAPFTPATLHANTVSILGRSVTVGPDGFPEQIRSSFAAANTHLVDKARDILQGPISLVVEEAGAGKVVWKPSDLRFESHPPGRVDWTATSRSGALTLRVQARMEFDGHIEYIVALSSAETLDVQDIRLEVPYSRAVAVYMMGLGQKGGYRPSSFHWQWDVQKNQDSVWVGDVNAGMQVSLRDEHYARPLNTNFYHLKPLVMPASWSNDGHGGCSLDDRNSETTLLRCYSGPRRMQPGETLYYNFKLLLTPFKPVDTGAHWHNRYYHKGDPPPSEVKATGANVINIHHGTSINPYLNYPFLRQQEMKAYIDEAHSLGMKVKIYYTVRELSDHAPEMFALRSLGHEIFVPGAGGGYSWLQEQLGSDYIAGWCVPTELDATIINSGASRWHNYYVEGIQYLAKNVGIDGIYLDDLAFDRSIMQRVRRVLDSNRPGALIDLHSANQYDERDGFASSANLYMGELPYINRLWFGEYFDYNASPDYYLIEISGIAFGLMGEMLQGGGNPWRGMVYGMTARMGASGDPRPLWKVWDEFGIEDSRMQGYWDPSTPVKTGREDILATSYVRQNTVLIAVASWAAATASIQLSIDWKALGMHSSEALLTAPAIDAFQEAATYSPNDTIAVPQGRGLLLILSARPGSARA
jgi:hypothetical protein